MPSHRSDLALYLGVVIAAAALIVAAVEASSAAVTVPIAFALGVLVALVLHRVVRATHAGGSGEEGPKDPRDNTGMSAGPAASASSATSPLATASPAPGDPTPGEIGDVGEPVSSKPSGPSGETPSDDVGSSTSDLESGVSLETVVVLQRLEESLQDIQPLTSAVALWLLDPASATYRLVEARGTMRPPCVPLDAGEGVVGTADDEDRPSLGRETLVLDGGESRQVWRFAWGLEVGEARGVLSVDVLTPERPDAVALEAAVRSYRAPLSGSLAVHIARDETRIVRSLLEVARALSRSSSEGRLLDTALDHAMEMSGAATGSVMLADDGDRLRIATARGLPDSVVEGTAVSKGEGIAGWVFAMGKPLLVEDIPSRNANKGRRDVRSAVSVPLKDEDGVLGVLNVGSQAYPARLTRSHVDALEVIGRQTAVALRNARAVAESRDLYFDTLRILAETMEWKNPYAAGGTRRTLDYARRLSRDMGMSSGEARAVEIAVLFHDLGMSAVEDGREPGRPLSTVERGIVAMHPVVAAQLLAEAPSLRAVAPIVYHHHERYDGEGYVDGLSGDEIPLGARVLAVADAFVAMTSPRPYRDEMTMQEAAGSLRENAGTQFDPQVVDVFLESVETSGACTEAVPPSA